MSFIIRRAAGASRSRAPVNSDARRHDLRTAESLLYLAWSAAPSLALLVLGGTWTRWPNGWRELPATAFSVGLALLVLLMTVVVIYTTWFPFLSSRPEALLFIAPVLTYLLTLLTFSRREGLVPARLTAFGLIGLVPLYYLFGFTLIASACSFNKGGC